MPAGTEKNHDRVIQMQQITDELRVSSVMSDCFARTITSQKKMNSSKSARINFQFSNEFYVTRQSVYLHLIPIHQMLSENFCHSKHSSNGPYSWEMPCLWLKDF